MRGADSIMLNLEDAVAEGTRRTRPASPCTTPLRRSTTAAPSGWSRINSLDPWREDIRVCVAGGADTIRIAKTESAADVHTVEGGRNRSRGGIRRAGG